MSVVVLLASISVGLAVLAVVLVRQQRRLNPYGYWLDRECWVRPSSRPRWRLHVVVAVSHNGAVCVRDCQRQEDRGYWIKKENVPWRVSFERSTPGDEEVA